MREETDNLRKRVQELEAAAVEQARLQQLVDYAAAGHDLARYMALGVLYVEPETRQIVDANDTCIELLGYPLPDLLNMRIDDLETAIVKPPGVDQTQVNDAIESRMYTATYRHHEGYPLTVTVHKRLLHRENRQLLYYRLADDSLHRRMWYELQRRDDDGFNFQQKLTTLNEITVELSKIESFDTLCYQVINLGVKRLGFDRMGMWLVDEAHSVMRGTYGMDEAGNIRPEHNQSWTYVGRQVSEFISGKTDKPLIFDQSPLYNDKSEIIHYGWQVTIPILDGQHCLGTLVADNFLNNQPIRNYEPELLRLYGITVAHLMELSRSREQAIELRVAHQLTHMLTEFITNIGHDFRTPLATINTNAYLLLRSQDEERRTKMANGIQDQVKHITGMVDRALEFVALQRNPTLETATVHVEALLKGIVHKYQPLIETKALQVDITVDEKLTLQADNAYLTRALSEIFANAVQYTEDGGQVSIEAIIYPQEMGIRVRDTGAGMDKSLLSRVFDPLFRGDEARSERHSGLGLAIAKAIVEAHGGRITAESVVGEGSSFEVMLPR